MCYCGCDYERELDTVTQYCGKPRGVPCPLDHNEERDPMEEHDERENDDEGEYED